MLLNDTLHLGVGLVLCVLGAFYITLVRAACAFLATTLPMAPPQPGRLGAEVLHSCLVMIWDLLASRGRQQ